MDTTKKLFLNILHALDDEKVLEELIIIGGWCLFIYREYFGNPISISSIRTADIDFLVSVRQRFSRNIDINAIFSKLDFEQVFSLNKGFIKYVHPELEAEFLVPLVGRPNDTPYEIDELKTNAQRLRFLDILVNYSRKLSYENMNIRVPEPAAFVINKLLVSTRRDNPIKKEKDLKAAKELGEYILYDEVQTKLLLTIYNSCSTKNKKTIKNTIELYSEKIYAIINQPSR